MSKDKKISPNKYNLLITGAGSGGHVITAISIAENLKEKFPNIYEQTLFVGAPSITEDKKNKFSLEEKLCTALNIPFVKIRAGKLQRKFSFYAIKQAFGILFSFIDAFWLIKKVRPKVILSFGGFISLPLVFWGHFFKSKVIIHEQTVNIGLSNKLASNFADTILLTFADSMKFLSKKNKSKALVVGYPLRNILFKINSVKDIEKKITKKKLKTIFTPGYIQQLKYIESSSLPFVLAMGGGLGSHILNMSFKHILRDLLSNNIVLLQTGDNKTTQDYQNLLSFRHALPKDLRKNLIIRDFIYDELGFLYKRANVFVGRSGAGAVYQVATFKIPSVFIPIPWVTRNEQYFNAEKLAKVGLAKILPEKDLKKSYAKLLMLIKEQLKSNIKINQSLLNKYFKPSATEKITKIIVNALHV